MPIFDYTCKECKVVFEKRVRKYDDSVNCPKCSEQATKMLGTTAFILKGEGFYGNGSFLKAKDGPVLDKELLRLSDRDLNYECNIPLDCD